MNWNTADEMALQSLLRRKEAAAAAQKQQLSTIAAAMVRDYGYPATAETESGISVRFLVPAIYAHGADLCAVISGGYRATAAEPKRGKRKSDLGFPPGVYHVNSRANPYGVQVYDPQKRKAAYLGSFPSLEAAIKARADHIAARDAQA